MNLFRRTAAVGMIITLATWVLPGCSQGPRYSDRALVYPRTKTVAVVDDYHGTKIADPYRWMEDLDTAELKEWVEAQNEVTFGYLEEIPQREKINKRLTGLWDYEKFGMPYKRGERYFFRHNESLQNLSQEDRP